MTPRRHTPWRSAVSGWLHRRADSVEGAGQVSPAVVDVHRAAALSPVAVSDGSAEVFAAAGERGVVWVRVLGRPAVTPPHGRGPTETDKLGQLTKLAVLLALRPGISSYDLDTAMWPVSKLDHEPDAPTRARKKSARRNQTITRLRTWLGDTTTGDRAVTAWTKTAGYRLHPEVRSDWDLWCLLVGTDPTTTPDRHLAQALDLVTAVPLSHPHPAEYGWAEHDQQHMIGRITDAAEELAARQLAAGDTHTAHTTALHGLSIDPGREALWRIAILAAHTSNDPAGATHLITAMLEELDELGGDPEPATTRLLTDLHHVACSAGRGVADVGVSCA